MLFRSPQTAVEFPERRRSPSDNAGDPRALMELVGRRRSSLRGYEEEEETEDEWAKIPSAPVPEPI